MQNWHIVGQKKLLNTIDQVLDNKLPRFAIVVGDKGSGKKVITEYIAKRSGLDWLVYGTKVDEIREAIEMSYTLENPSLYSFFDCDEMSSIAMNSLLKVTEEPPKLANFIITTNDRNKILPTIYSRGQVFFMDQYSQDELNEYCEMRDISGSKKRCALEVCRTPGEIDIASKWDLDEFYDYAERIVDDIDQVGIGNALKIPYKLAIWSSSSPEQWDINLFMRQVMIIAQNRLLEYGDECYCKCLDITRDCKRKLTVTGVNKQFLVDNWIMRLYKCFGGK